VEPMAIVNVGHMQTPNRKIRPTGEEFRKLIDEGWRLWLDQDGYVRGYYPPSLWDRMTRLD
jgi:hypothetical protein